ncbi:MAG: carboxypeptidase-like regulatory domain-containing protein, partial [bacterium]|nr:carboxypeptidase-like regulatory domain-containing protein [bacterium]
MRKILITACFLCSLLDVYAQKPVLHGLLKSNDGEALPGATVVLLNASDSTMHSFTISDFEGKFRLKNVSKGDYVLQITFVGFASIKKGISISD